MNIATATAGQEDPFELDSNLLLSSGRHGEDRKRQYNSFYTTMKHRYLTIWLTYCISIDLLTVLVKNYLVYLSLVFLKLENDLLKVKYLLFTLY